MRRLPEFLKTSLLISLCAMPLAADAQNARAQEAKRKLAAGPVPGLTPPAVQRPVPSTGPVTRPPAISKKQINASYPSGSFERGLYLKQLGKSDEALLQFIKAAQENPRNVRAFYEQALIFKQKGKVKLAKSALEQALAVAPTNSQARSFLVQLHFESGNLIGAASEVGKLLNLNQTPKEKPHSSMQISAPSAAIQIASGNLPAKQSEDASVDWLQAAADREENKARSTEAKSSDQAKSPAPKSESELSFSDVLAQIGSTGSDPQTTNEEKPEQKTEVVSAQKSEPAPTGTVENTTANISEPGIIARMKDGDLISWVRDKFSFGDNKNAAAEQKPGPEKDSGKESRLANLSQGVKDRLGQVHVPQMRLPEIHRPKALHIPEMHMPDMHMPKALHMPEVHMPDMHMPKAIRMPHLPLSTNNKIAMAKPDSGFGDKKLNDAVAQAMKNKKLDNKVSSEAVIKPKELEQTSPAETIKAAAETKGNLPPAIAKVLQEQFAGQTVITTSNGQQQQLDLQKQKEKKEQDEKLKEILASVPAPVEVPKETGRPHLPGRNYGLLKNNALQHIGADSTIELKEDKAFLNNIVEEASKTFAAIIPSISWKLPAIPGLKPKDRSGADIVAAVPAPTQVQVEDNLVSQNVAKPSAPVAPIPLDVARILNRITGSSAPTAPPINTRLSATIPIAGAPANIEAMLPPMPQSGTTPKTAQPVPSLRPSGLTTNQTRQLIPQTNPQRQAAVQTPAPAALPPIVEDAIKMAEPIIKPAIEAANNLVQNIAPMMIPKSDGLGPLPVNMAGQSGTNAVPMPVGANMNMENYVPNMEAVQLPEQALQTEAPSTQNPADGGLSAAALVKTGGRKLLSMQEAKSGAFTYIKPVMDSDGNFMTGGKQVRTIKPLPGKPQEAKAAPPEDAITKRMRYLLEHGTANLRRGEAFMFSEETGEGILFMPDGSSERRKLQEAQDAEKVLRARRPDIVHPKDLQYSLSLLGKLLPAQQQDQNNGMQQGQNIGGPTLDQLMNQMNQNSKGIWGWMKKSLNINN